MALALHHRRRVAESVIREAGALAAGYFARRRELAVDHKGPQDLVSEADRECEKLIVEALMREFPDDGFLGEEGGERNPGAEAVWVIDPIDGTRNFLDGVPFWCISIGLVSGGRSVLGLIHHPAAEELFVAEDGAGAFVNGVPIRVSGKTDIGEARICVGFGFREPVADHVRAVGALLGAKSEYCRLGSGALGLAYTAAGRFDGFWERHLNAWDAAAGLALVREAGGYVNDFLAAPLREGSEILAATPGLVAELKHLVGFGRL